MACQYFRRITSDNALDDIYVLINDYCLYGYWFIYMIKYIYLDNILLVSKNGGKMKQHGKDMKKLVRYMEDNGYLYEDDCSMSTVYFSKVVNNKHYVFALTEPHEGNKNRWMLRAENRRYFDRWSNVSYEEYYYSADDFIKRALIDLRKRVGKRLGLRGFKKRIGISRPKIDVWYE